MGVLGWTEQQTLDTTMPAILLAYKGRMKMLREMFKTVAGFMGVKIEETVEADSGMTPALFDALFGGR